MIEAANYDAIEALKNGMRVRIRSIRQDDKSITPANKQGDPVFKREPRASRRS